LAATLAIGATSTEFENQEAKNNGEKVFEYLTIDQESNDDIKKGQVRSRGDSFNMTAAS